MESNIPIFVCEALMSSELQINSLDKNFNSELGGYLGTAIRIICNDVKNVVILKDSRLFSVLSILNTVEDICRNAPYDHTICSFLSQFFHYMGKSVKYLNLDKAISSENIQLSSDEIIEIDLDDDDASIDLPVEYPNDENDKFIFTLDWINLLKFTVNDMIDSNSHKCNNFYETSIRNGFLNCLKRAISIQPDQQCNILDLTDTIESLADLRKANKNENDIMFNANGFPNPIFQLLATALRATVEAIKISCDRIEN